MENKNTYTLNKIVNEFAKHGVNILQILESLSALLTDSKDYISITIKDADGNEKVKKLPSIGKIQKDISALQALLDDLYDFKNNEVFVVSDGIRYPVIIPSYPYDLLPPINISKISFTYKNSKFYTRIYAHNIEKSFKYKKYIAEGLTDEAFDSIEVANEEELVAYLESNGIPYSIEEQVVKNIPGKVKYKGEFQVVAKNKNVYTLDTFYYSTNSSSPETLRLNAGDILFTDGVEAKIISINYSTKEVTLETVKGYKLIAIGSTLKLLSPIEQPSYLEIPSSISEKYFLFIRNINETFNVESKESAGPIKVNVSSLYGDDEIGENVSIADFNSGLEPDSIMPRKLGLKPNAPILAADAFKVVKINDHLFQDSQVIAITEKISRKNELASEINEIDKALEEKKAVLTTTSNISNEKIKAIENDISSLTAKRKIKTNEYASLVNELSTINNEYIKNLAPKYRVRGFFDMPVELYSKATGKQHIIQFIISYRYKGLNQNTTQLKNFTRTDEDGNKKFGVFSDWVEVYSPKRLKVYDSELGKWVWEEQKTDDGQQVNINQIDIPISKGEIVEFRVRSVAEPGYPVEPMLSGWSNIISIQFPDEISDTSSIGDMLEASLSDTAAILIDSIISAKGLDTHTQNSITKNEQYFAHPAKEISSGLYDASGNMLSLEDVIKTFKQDILSLQKAVQNELPTLNVALLTPEGNEIALNKNALNSIFAGYYVDDVSILPETERNGAIIEKTYQLFLYNSSGIPLYLNSGIFGGMEQTLDAADYMLKAERAYENVPIVLNGTFTSQMRGQYIYARYKNYTLTKDFYDSDINLKSIYYNQTGYEKQANLNVLNVANTLSPDFADNETGAYAYIDLEDRQLIYVGAPEYGSVKELKPGKENGIKVPIVFKYKLTDINGQPPAENVEFRKRLGIDIFLFNQNTVSIDFEFIAKLNKIK